MTGLLFPFPDLPDQGIDPGLLHCRQILNRLSRQGSHNETSLILSSLCPTGAHLTTLQFIFTPSTNKQGVIKQNQ